MSAPGAPTRRIDGLRLIGLFKVGKAVLLLLTTWGVYQLLDPARIDRLYDWVYSLTDGLERRVFERAVDWMASLSDAHIHSIVVVTSLYVAILFTEGLGLWFRQRWAEWLTAIASSLLIPFEAWKIVAPHSNHRGAAAVTLVINVLIVAYLVRVLLRQRERA